MKHLFIETSTDRALLVLAENGEPIAEKNLPGGPGMSEKLAYEAAALTQDARPDEISVGLGPGSYTGIRVGAALGLGLGTGWGVPVTGFCSLEAFDAPAVFDARSGGVYILKEGKPARVAVEEIEDWPLAFTPDRERLQKRTKGETIWIDAAPSAHSILRAHRGPLSFFFEFSLERNPPSFV
jgi:tRNA threonylcarbamoyl adenosine modification protein YeaZ